MHTPKGARRVGGCDSDRRSDDDNTVGGWMVVYGVASVSVLTYILKERERTSRTGRVTVSIRRFPPTIHRMEPSTHMCEGVMVCRKGEGGFEGVIGWVRVRACSRRGLMVWLCDGLCEMLPLLLCILWVSMGESSSLKLWLCDGVCGMLLLSLCTLLVLTIESWLGCGVCVSVLTYTNIRSSYL